MVFLLSEFGVTDVMPAALTPVTKLITGTALPLSLFPLLRWADYFPGVAVRIPIFYVQLR
jgi:hypothetical protein